MAEELHRAKNNLQRLLGVEFRSYCNLLRRWFLEQISKEDFDLQARLLFTTSTVHYHNDFFAALLNKCNIQQTIIKRPTRHQGVTFRSKGLKALKRIHRAASSSSSLSIEKTFHESSLLSNSENVKDVSPALAYAHLNGISAQTCSKEGVLPDPSMIHGRLLLACWENNSDDVDKDCLPLVIYALREILKDLLHACIEVKRTHLVFDGRFQHLFGVDDPSTALNVFLPDANNRISGETVELKQCAISSTLVSRPQKKISIADLLETLKLTPSLIPSQSLYNRLVERLLCFELQR